MSNGSEHMPERCVHAPVGPDWAGLREPSSWKERALVAEEDRDELRRALDDAIGVANKNKIALDSAEAERDALAAMEQRLTDHIVQLAAERDALVKDRDTWRRLAIVRETAVAERDALRTQLDRVRAARAAHPICYVHTDTDVVKCGWKRAIADIDAALEGAPDGQ